VEADGMTTLRDAAQKVLDYWESCGFGDAVMVDKMDDFRAALAETAEQEPMGVPQGWKLVPDVPTNEWINNLARRRTGSFEDVPFAEIHQSIAELLESAPEAPQPAKREPLTDAEIGQVRWQCRWNRMSTDDNVAYATTQQLDAFARAIERAHGIGEHE
jgi:hypothetical protein